MSLDCRRKLLAECSWGKLEHCSCGTVHFTMGPITLRLMPEVIAELGAMFTGASQRLSGHTTHGLGRELDDDAAKPRYLS